MSISITSASLAVNPIYPAACPDWEPGVSVAPDAPEHRADRVSLAFAIELEVRRYRAMDTAFGDLMAEHIAELATLAGLTGARDAEQLRDRAACYGR
jgi:hypothetical protein